jgi:hypothetical protein
MAMTANPSDAQTPGFEPAPLSMSGRLGLGLILLAALVLRVREAMQTPLWFDEIFSLWTVRGTLGETMRLLAADIHPPLHTLLLDAWRSVGGENVMWLKTLPILIGLATILVLFAAASEMFDRRVGFVAAALLALHRTHIYFSQELRSYVLLTLILLLAVWLGWRWIGRARPRDAALYALCVALAFYTHYLSFLILGLLGAWGLFALRREPRRIPLWLGLHAAAAVLFVPQVPTFLHQLALAHDHWAKPPTLVNLADLARQICFGARYMVPVLAVLSLVPLTRGRERRPTALLWWMALVPPALAYWLTFHGMHLFVERYMFFTLPYWCALFAAGVTNLPPRRIAGSLAALALIAFAARSTALHRPHPEAVALDGAVRRVGERLAPGDLVICCDTHSMFTMRYRFPSADVRLLMTWPRLPYYEGAVFIPDSLRLVPDSLEALSVRGQRWWGLRTRHGGIPSDQGAMLMDSLAKGPRAQLDMVTLWAGTPGMTTSLEAENGR